MEVYREVIKDMIPVRTEAVVGAFTSGFGLLVVKAFGGWNDLLSTLLTLMVLDYISGMLAAIINPDLALNSQKGFKGIARKVFILVVVALAHHVDVAIGTNECMTLAACFYIGNEGLSIIENAAKSGVPIPDVMKNSLAQLTREKKEREKRG